MAASSTDPRAQYVIASTYRLSEAGIAKLRADFLDVAKEHDIPGEKFLIVTRFQSEIIILSCPEAFGDQYGGIARVLIVQLIRSYTQKQEEKRRFDKRGNEPILKVFEEATMTDTDAATVNIKELNAATTIEKGTDVTKHASILQPELAKRQCIHGNGTRYNVKFLSHHRLAARTKTVVGQCFQRNRSYSQINSYLLLRTVCPVDEDDEDDVNADLGSWRHVEAIVESMQPADVNLINVLERGVKFNNIRPATNPEDENALDLGLISDALSSTPTQTSFPSATTSEQLLRVPRPQSTTVDTKPATANYIRSDTSQISLPLLAAPNVYNLPLQPESLRSVTPANKSQQAHNPTSDDADSDAESFYSTFNDNSRKALTHDRQKTKDIRAIDIGSSSQTTVHAAKDLEDSSSDDDEPLDVMTLVKRPTKTVDYQSQTQMAIKRPATNKPSKSASAETMSARPTATSNGKTASSAAPVKQSQRPNWNEVDTFGIKGLAKTEAEWRHQKKRYGAENDHHTEWKFVPGRTQNHLNTPSTYEETVLGGSEKWASVIAKETLALGPQIDGMLIDISNADQWPDLSSRPSQPSDRSQSSLNVMDFHAPPLQPVKLEQQNVAFPGAMTQATGECEAVIGSESNDGRSDSVVDRLSPSRAKQPMLRRTMGQMARKPTPSAFTSHVKEILGEGQQAVFVAVDFGVFGFETSPALVPVFDQQELAHCFRTKTNEVFQVKATFLPQLLQTKEAAQILSFPFDDNLLLDSGIEYDQEICFDITVKQPGGGPNVLRLLWSPGLGFQGIPSVDSMESISVHNMAHIWDAKVNFGRMQLDDMDSISSCIVESAQAEELENGEKRLTFRLPESENRYIHTVENIVMEERFVRRSDNLMLSAKHEKLTRLVNIDWIVFRSIPLLASLQGGLDDLYTATSDTLTQRYAGNGDVARWQARLVVSSKSASEQRPVQGVDLADLIQDMVNRICKSMDGVDFGVGQGSKRAKKKKAPKPQGFW